MKQVFFAAILLVVLGCHTSHSNQNDQARLFDNHTELTVFPVADGWGYSIAVNGEKFIRQETVPVVQGSHPFATKKQAETVGSWVATRIRHNEAFSLTMPVLQSLLAANTAQQ